MFKHENIYYSLGLTVCSKVFIILRKVCLLCICHEEALPYIFNNINCFHKYVFSSDKIVKNYQFSFTLSFLYHFSTPYIINLRVRLAFLSSFSLAASEDLTSINYTCNLSL